MGSFPVSRADVEDTPGPIYDSIVEAFSKKITSDELMPGASLPTVRELANHLGCSRNTVSHAYSVLQRYGLIESTVGRGTRVVPRVVPQAGKKRLSKLPEEFAVSNFEETSRGSRIKSLAMGACDTRLIDMGDFFAAVSDLRNDSEWLFHSPTVNGYLPFSEQISKSLHKRGLDFEPHQLIVTRGYLGTLDMYLSGTLSPGEPVLTEEPSFLEVDRFFRHLHLVPHGVPISKDGVDLDRFKELAKKTGAKVMFIQPTTSSGHTRTLTIEQRRDLIVAARECGVTIFEMHLNDQIQFSGNVPPSLFELDEEHNTVFAECFTSSIAPGINVGYMVVPKHATESLSSVVTLSDVPGTKFMQAALANYIETGAFSAHLARVVPRYAKRCEAACRSLSMMMPEEVEWAKPSGGFSIWLDLPEKVDTAKLYKDGIENSIAFATGNKLVTPVRNVPGIRIGYGTHDDASIYSAISTLSGLIKDQLAQ